MRYLQNVGFKFDELPFRGEGGFEDKSVIDLHYNTPFFTTPSIGIKGECRVLQQEIGIQVKHLILETLIQPTYHNTSVRTTTMVLAFRSHVIIEVCYLFVCCYNIIIYLVFM